MDIHPQPGEGKSVLITGCSSGIGRTTALHLAELGYTVFATVRKPADQARLAELRLPNLVPLCPLDLTHREDIGPLVQSVQEELRRLGQPGLYALINNAGGGGVAPLELLDLDVFSAEVQGRLVGALALVQAFLPALRAGSGRIVWIATPATIPTAYVSSIHACDFAVNCLARTLDIELKPWNLPVIQVRCGGIRTDKGLTTPQEAQAILRHPRGELYRLAVSRWGEEMAAFDRKRTEPVEVARVVAQALSARQPRRRYRVGYMSGAAALLELLPQAWTDAILKARV